MAVIVAIGYGVIDANGNILVHTVGPTERSAKVNWLGTDGGMRITKDWSDEIVTKAFEHLRGKCEVIEVEIRRRTH